MPQFAILIDIFKLNHLLGGANDPLVWLLTFKDSLKSDPYHLKKCVIYF